MKDVENFDVLIVGAGPVGLVVASELARAGVTATIIDRREKYTRHSKANVIWPRSLELLARLGLTDILARQARQVQAGKFHRDGQVIASYNFSDLVDTPYPFALTMPQPVTETAIEQHLRQSGVFVDRGTELVDLEQKDHAVEVTLRRSDGTLDQRQFAWVIGTDGSSSTVREKSNISFNGEVVPVIFTLVDAYASGLPANEAGYYFGMRGRLAIAPIGPDLFRFATSAFTPESVDSVTETLQDLLEEMNISGQVNRVRYAAQFQASVKQASTYRSGRVLLAGDAAHLSTPASGQGMNTGFQDAVALGWRLAHILLGHLDQSSLDEYDKERRSHVDGVLAWTRAQTAQVDENAQAEAPGMGMPSPRQMAQLDVCYGEDGIRIPPLPESVLRYRDGYDPAAPSVLLTPGAVYSAEQWRQEVARIRSVAPAYFQIIDLADTALEPRFTSIIGQGREAFIVRPDQHLQLRLDPCNLSADTFTELGWKR
ncbi:MULTISPECIES: FAD-dependent monooxygenase [Rothia]|uniref:FAD-dependent monooxygenase n=1 Tax=Rothia TaxID=32207 RepID=UPI0002F9BE50|nr:MULTISPECIES: FAD-dependent monooxygenase [Rothia]OFN45975.1 hypothetical protein HMPREF2554_10670 [Rothia sp. HMSC071F11]